MKALPIPKDEQLEALVAGLTEVYRLLELYLGDLNTCGEFRKHITVSRRGLADHLRQHPELAKRHVYKVGSPKYHEFPVLEAIGTKYRVYEMDHARPSGIEEFDNLFDAAAAFLLWNLDTKE